MYQINENQQLTNGTTTDASGVADIQESNNNTYSENTINKDSATGAYLVCAGATCKCSAGAIPFINLPITSQTKVFAQNKLVGTIQDTRLSPAPFATCRLNPNILAGRPCLYSTPGIWDIKADDVHPRICGKLLLTDNAQMKCPQFPAGILSIVTHGQNINVADTSTEEVDDIAYTINALSDPVVEEPTSRNISVTNISCNGVKAASKKDKKGTVLPQVNKVEVRAGEKVQIITKHDKVKNRKGKMTPELISWCVWLREDEEDETAPLTTEEGQIYEHYGPTIEFSVKKGQALFIEAFGAKVETRQTNNKTYTDCMLLIEGGENDIREITKLNGIEKLKENFIAKAGTAVSFEIASKFGNFTPEELELLEVTLKDAEKNIVKFISKQHIISLEGKTIKNEGIYTIEVKYKEKTVTYNLEIYDNYITSISPGIRLTRIGDVKEFKVQLKHTDDNLDQERITWQIINQQKTVVEEGSGNTIQYNFPHVGKYTIKANYNHKFGVITLKEKVIGTSSIEAIRNYPASVSIPADGYVGNSVQINMQTVLDQYWSYLDGGVEWIINYIPDENATVPDKKATIVSCDSTDSTSEWNKKDIQVTGNTLSFIGGNVLLFTPLGLGKFEITARMHTKSSPQKNYEVKNGEIIAWTFVNNYANRLSKIGWKQKFKAHIHVKGWEKQSIQVCLYYKIRINKRVLALLTSAGVAGRVIAHYNRKRFVCESIYKKTLQLDDDGSGFCEIGDDVFWEQIVAGKTGRFLGKDREIGKNAELYLAVEKSPYLYEYDSMDSLKTEKQEDVLLNSLIAPVTSHGSLRHSLTMDEENTTYEAMFLETDKNKLTRIVQYGENVIMAFQIYCAQTFDPAQYQYKFGLFENQKDRDREVPIDEAKRIIRFDESYKSGSLKLNTGALPGKDTHQEDKGTDYNPRCYYLALYRRKSDKDKWGDPIHYYPAGYNNSGWFTSGEKKNDDYLLELEPEIQAGDHISALSVTALSYVTNLEKEEWEKEGKNVEEETIKRKEEIKEAVINHKNSEQINKLDENKRQNYFLQLKVAKETSLNKSLIALAPIIIGEPLSSKKKQVNTCVCKEYDLIWGSKVNCAFRKKVVQICLELWGEANKIKMSNALMAVMAAESSRTFKSNIIAGNNSTKEKSQLTIRDFYQEKTVTENGKSIKKRSSRAVGLIQFTQPALEALGKFTAGSGFDALDTVKLEFAKMDEVEQLDWVKKYFMLSNAHKKIIRPEDIYIHVFAPKGVGKPFETVLYTKENNPEEYEKNKSVDTDGDGKITSADLLIRFYDLYAEGVSLKFDSRCEFAPFVNVEGWHDPVVNPQINKYNFDGYIKPQSACFGNVRSRSDLSKRFHSGVDLFAIPIVTKVYACLDCKYHAASTSTLELDLVDTKKLIEQMKCVEYKLLYAPNEYLAGISTENYNGKKADFVLNETDTIRFQYIHLDSIRPKSEIADKDGIVKAGTHIGYAGVEGNADKTHAPHLHFGIKNITKDSNGKYFLNPALFINLHPYENKIQDDAKKPWRDKKNRSN